MNSIIINSLKKYGLDGATGAQGPQGVNGSNGATGAQGFQGLQGLNGYQGLRGYQGVSLQPQGPQGVEGTEDSWDYVWYKNSDTTLTGGANLTHLTPVFTAGTYLVWIAGQYASSIRTVQGHIDLVDATTEDPILFDWHGQTHYLAQTGYKYNNVGSDVTNFAYLNDWNSSGSSGGIIPVLAVVTSSVDFKIRWDVKHNVGDLGSVTWYKHSFIKIKEVV